MEDDRDYVLTRDIETRVRRLIDDLAADDLTLALLEFAQLYRALSRQRHDLHGEPSPLARSLAAVAESQPTMGAAT